MRLSKPLFAIPLFLLLMLSSPSFSQRFYGAVSAGMNLSQVDGDEVYGFNKAGLTGGPSVIFPFGKDRRWSLSMELLFSQIGSYRGEKYSNDTTGRNNDSIRFYDGYKLSLNYVQVPVLFHYTDKQIIAVGIGLQYGRLIGHGEWEDHNDSKGLYKTDSLSFNNSDLQIIADVKLRLYKRIWFNVRYGYSISPIRTRTFENYFTHSEWTRKQYNNVITFKFIYVFNEPLPVKAKKK